MAFTDRFLELPIQLENLQKVHDAKTLGIEDVQDFIASTIKIKPLEIVAYYGMPDYDDENKNITHVDFKSGLSVNVYLPPKEFERKVNEFDSKN